jgi:hypothetical protein
MDEFNFNINSEIGTSVSKLKKTKVKNDDELYNLIKDLENRLEDIELSNSNTIQLNTKPVKKINKLDNIKINYKDLIFLIIIFILLNDSCMITLIYNIPYLKNMNNPYPNLIIRTLLFGLLFFIYKKYIK